MYIFTLILRPCHNNVLQLSVKKQVGSASEEEATIRPGMLHPLPSSPEGSSWSSADTKVLATLTEHLRTFCLTAEKLK